MNEQNFDALKLENQLCFPLYAASRELIKNYTAALNELGLTYTQYIAMMVMWERKCVNVKELGNALYLDSGTLTPLLKKLEAKGLVTRARSEVDERNLVVRITEQGDKLKEAALHIPKILDDCINLSKDEYDTLYKILYKLLSE